MGSNSGGLQDYTQSAIGKTFTDLVRTSPGSDTALSGLGEFNQQAGESLQVPDLFGEVSKNLDRLRVATEAQTTVVGANTTAVTSNTALKSATQTLSSVGQSAGSLFGGLTALPLISGIAKLFGFGGGVAQQPPLQKYSPPPAAHFDVAMQEMAGQPGIFGETAYNQFGAARVVDSTFPPVPSYAPLLAGSPNSSQPDSNGQTLNQTVASSQPLNTARVEAAPAPTHVTVNIQAMDSRSFLDRSGDIAQAVREAMLNMHSINDVVNDL